MHVRRGATRPRDGHTPLRRPPLKPPDAAAPPRGTTAPTLRCRRYNPRAPLHRRGGNRHPPQAPPLRPPRKPLHRPGGNLHPPSGAAVKTPGRRCTAPGETGTPPQVPAVIRPAFKPGQRTAIPGRARMPGGTDPWTSSAARPKKISVRPRAPRRGTARRTTATGRRHRAPSPPPRRSRSCGPRRRSTRGACTPPRTARRR